MNNVFCIAQKQLCNPLVFKHGVSTGIAARRTFSFRTTTSIASLWQQQHYAHALPSFLLRHDHDQNISPSSRSLHSSANFQKKKSQPGSFAPKPRPQKAPLGRPVERSRAQFGLLGKQELARIFQHDVDYLEGNETLRMLHERRTEGSLVDKGVQPDAKSSIPSESLLKALEWLRKEYPVDEKAAAERWAAEEAARLEQKYIADAERLGIYKPATEVSDRSATNTSESVLDELRAYKKLEAKRKEEAAEKSGQAQASRELALARQEENQKKQLETEERISKRREERAKKGMVTEDGEIPDMTTAQRLFRPTLFGLLFMCFTTVAVATYQPVEKSERLFPDVPLAVATIGGITAVNFLVFLAWRVPPAWRILNSWFTMVPAYPFTISFLAGIFSHRTFKHLASNFVFLYLFGTDLHEDIGRGPFMQLYLCGGVIGSLFSLYYYVLTRNFTVFTLGSSGAVCAVATAWAPVNYFKPQPSTETGDFAKFVAQWAILSFAVLGHIPASMRFGVDWVCHVGGALWGLSFGYYMVRQGVTRHSQTKDSGADVAADDKISIGMDDREET